MYKGRDLAGTCGIPLECDRVYVEVECAPRGLYERADVPLRLIWPDGRSFPIRSTARRVEHGRAAFGNLVERFDVFIGKSEKVRTIWRQDGRWFVAKPKMRMPRPNSALLSQSKASSSVEPPEVAAPPARRRGPINPPHRWQNHALASYHHKSRIQLRCIRLFVGGKALCRGTQPG